MNKTFWLAALNRAIRTMAQTAIAAIGSAALIESINWWTVLSASLVAGVLSILTSIATGLPEVQIEERKPPNKPKITVKAYEDYDEDGSPIVDKPCEACDLTPYLEGVDNDGAD